VFWEVRHGKDGLVISSPVVVNAPQPNIVGKPGAGIPNSPEPISAPTSPPTSSAPGARPSQSGSGMNQTVSLPPPENARGDGSARGPATKIDGAARGNTTSPPIVKKAPPGMHDQPSATQTPFGQPPVDLSVNHPPASHSPTNHLPPSSAPVNQPPASQPALSPPPLSADGMMQNAQTALARGNLISPADDSALYWARRVQEVQPQNQTAIQIEDMILVGSIRLIEAEEKASRYENASRRLDALQALYPSRRDLFARMRSEIKKAQSGKDAPR
jgi:hypothetical protein